MSWSAGMAIAMGLLIVLYVALAIFAAAARKMGRDEFTEHQWKDIRKQDFRRRMEERARKERAGIR